MGGSFWQKNRLVTQILFDLCLFEHFGLVANFEQQSIVCCGHPKIFILCWTVLPWSTVVAPIGSSSKVAYAASGCWPKFDLQSQYLFIRYLLRLFDSLAHSNLSATFATDQKWPTCHIRTSYQSLAGSLEKIRAF